MACRPGGLEGVGYPIDYAFVCIDQLTDGDSARQDAVYRAVTEAGVPFIDSGGRWRGWAAAGA